MPCFDYRHMDNVVRIPYKFSNRNFLFKCIAKLFCILTFSAFGNICTHLFFFPYHGVADVPPLLFDITYTRWWSWISRTRVKEYASDWKIVAG